MRAAWFRTLFLPLCLTLTPTLTAASDTPATTITPSQPFWVEQLTKGLNTPWSMAWLPNKDLLIVEKFGGLRIFRDGKLAPKVIAGPSSAYQGGPNGLLEIALDPDFKSNQRIFLSFTEGSTAGSHCAVYRARFKNDALVDGEVIYRGKYENKVPPFPPCGAILFLPDKTFLLGSPVDEEHRHLVQQMDNDLGKIIRLDRNGKAPKDNPFVGKPGILPEIYAYGTRSPLAFVRDPKTGVIWEHENGPRGGDELNVMKPGANYGWPLVSYGTDYSGTPISESPEMPGVEPPIVYWVPSIAPSGMEIYDGPRYPAWRGDFFITALRGAHLRRVRLKDMKPVEQEVLLSDLKERLRAVKTGPDGYMYILTDNTNGRLLRLQPGRPTPAQESRVAKATPNPFSPTTTVGRVNLTPDIARGKALFEQQCSSCHSTDPAVPAQQGPNLHGVIGRVSGTQPGFQFSPAMQSAARKWSTRIVEHFIADPEGLVPGTIMSAPPVTDPQARTDIVGYLASVSPGAKK